MTALFLLGCSDEGMPQKEQPAPDVFEGEAANVLWSQPMALELDDYDPSVELGCPSQVNGRVFWHVGNVLQSVGLDSGEVYWRTEVESVPVGTGWPLWTGYPAVWTNGSTVVVVNHWGDPEADAFYAARLTGYDFGTGDRVWQSDLELHGGWTSPMPRAGDFFPFDPIVGEGGVVMNGLTGKVESRTAPRLFEGSVGLGSSRFIVVGEDGLGEIWDAGGRADRVPLPLPADLNESARLLPTGPGQVVVQTETLGWWVVDLDAGASIEIDPSMYATGVFGPEINSDPSGVRSEGYSADHWNLPADLPGGWLYKANWEDEDEVRVFGVNLESADSSWITALPCTAAPRGLWTAPWLDGDRLYVAVAGAAVGGCANEEVGVRIYELDRLDGALLRVIDVPRVLEGLDTLANDDEGQEGCAPKVEGGVLLLSTWTQMVAIRVADQ